MKSPITEARDLVAETVRAIGEEAEADAIENGDRDHNYPAIMDAKLAYTREVAWKAGFSTGAEVATLDLLEEEWGNYASLFETANVQPNTDGAEQVDEAD